VCPSEHQFTFSPQFGNVFVHMALGHWAVRLVWTCYVRRRPVDYCANESNWEMGSETRGYTCVQAFQKSDVEPKKLRQFFRSIFFWLVALNPLTTSNLSHPQAYDRMVSSALRLTCLSW